MSPENVSWNFNEAFRSTAVTTKKSRTTLWGWWNLKKQTRITL